MEENENLEAEERALHEQALIRREKLKKLQSE